MTCERESTRHTLIVDKSHRGASGARKESPWISIVTPVMNGLPELKLTWESLKVQDRAGVEWVVIDSSRAREEVPRFLDEAVDLHVTYRWQKPRGIFVAMNRGITEARGTYTYFLNAGDTFAFPESLAVLKSAIDEYGQPPWVYADVAMVDDQGRGLVPHGWVHEEERERCFARGHFPCHQGTVVRTSVIRSLGGFDPSYIIGGDYDLFLRVDRLYPPVRLPFTLARFAPGGASSRRWFTGIREFHRARRLSLRPSGWQAVRERVDTVWYGGKTVLYRSLWAPGKPLHLAVRRIRD